MGRYLNRWNDSYQEVLNSDIYVDKSMLISITNSNLGTNDKYMCVTRMRRSGKSMALGMLNAYYSKGCDSQEQFKNLKISKDESYQTHLNKHYVFWIDLTGVYCEMDDEEDFVVKFEESVLKDLKRTYKLFDFNNLSLREAIIKLNRELDERFIILIDEWDLIFREQEENRELGYKYLEFLNQTFTSCDVSDCIDLVYMTGIYPIKRYTDKSILSMFKEYNMITPFGLSEYFGFTEDETKELCLRYNVDFNKVKSWYGSYEIEGIKLYNPLDIDRTLLRNKFFYYWTDTSSIEVIINCLNCNDESIRTIIGKLIIGNKIPINLNLANDLININSSNKAFITLIYLGYLAYDEVSSSCYIPNYEILKEFGRVIKVIDWKEYKEAIVNSFELYKATLKGDLEFINETFDNNHRTIIEKLNEETKDVIQMIVYLSYFDCIDDYFMIIEDSDTINSASVVFIPKDHNHIPMIVELKVNETVDTALNQIKDKKYVNLFDGYKGKVLFVGITYDSKTLTHDSKTEYIEI